MSRTPDHSSFTQASERELLNSVATLRARYGDDVAHCAVAAMIECLDFISRRGHGNITLAVKDHRVASKVRFEYYRDLSLERGRMS